MPALYRLSRLILNKCNWVWAAGAARNATDALCRRSHTSRLTQRFNRIVCVAGLPLCRRWQRDRGQEPGRGASAGPAGLRAGGRAWWPPLFSQNWKARLMPRATRRNVKSFKSDPGKGKLLPPKTADKTTFSSVGGVGGGSSGRPGCRVSRGWTAPDRGSC